MGKVAVHIPLQPISQSMDWQAPHKLSALLRALLGCLGEGFTGNLCFILPQVLPFRHLIENWGGWDGDGDPVEEGEQQCGGRVLTVPLTVVQIRSCLR